MNIHVCLAMMIKNEEKTILKSLDSCKPIISSIRIFDTGSTDTTLEIIEKFKTENPSIEIFVKQGIFEDFEVSRNVLLEYIEEDSRVQFVILLDSNDELRGGDKLIQFLEKEVDKTRENTEHYASGYLLRQRWYSGSGMDTYFNIRLIRGNSGWRYHAPVHEYIQNDADDKAITMRIDDAEVFIYQDRTQDCENTFKRFQRDKDILLKEHFKNPEDTRTLFYLAQTYGSLGMSTDAYYYYKLRVKYGGYEEERYHSFFRLGETAKNTGMESEVFIQWWIKAIECLPIPRVEPIIELANYYLFNNVNYHIAAMFTSYALTLDYPTYCNLFINRIHYDYTRYQLDGIAEYYLNNFEQGLSSCRKAIEYNQHLIETVNTNSVEMIKYKMQFDINNEKNYLERMEKTNDKPRDETWYNYTIYELENCILQEFNNKLFFKENTKRYELEVDILLKTFETNPTKISLLYHIAHTFEKLDKLNDAYYYYKLYIEKILESIEKQAQQHIKERHALHHELKEQQIIKKIDEKIINELNEEQVQILNNLDEQQFKKLNELTERHQSEKTILKNKIYSENQEEMYHAYLRLGDLAKLLKMDSSIFIAWWIKSMELFEQPRIEALIKLTIYYTFDNIRYQIANMYLQTALKLSRPDASKSKLFLNKLHYDYTRYHLDGIVQYYLKNYQQGYNSCIKAINFSKYIAQTCNGNVKIKNLFLQTKMNTDSDNLKFYIDILEKKQKS
jgi:hypothetical protein